MMISPRYLRRPGRNYSSVHHLRVIDFGQDRGLSGALTNPVNGLDNSLVRDGNKVRREIVVCEISKRALGK
ncbi:MAG: hypothetical protein ACI89J_001299 [Hyphomicrobiaceae bacterium]|jgi:hypothetical protein